MKNTEIYSEEWCEMVFEGKNHEYGAYELRKNYVKRHIIAALLSSTLVTMVIGSPIIINKVIHSKVKPKMEESIIISDFILNKPEKNIEKLAFKEPEKILNTIKSVAPIISDIDDANDDMTPQDVLLNDKRVIANVTIDNQSNDPDAKIFNDKIIVAEPIEIKTYIIVSQMPVFPGGEEELYNYLRTYMKYPRNALQLNINGIVYTSFIINQSGNIEDIKILRGIGGGCDEEALRVLREMPKWNPGKQNGVAVNVRLNLPINFELK